MIAAPTLRKRPAMGHHKLVATALRFACATAAHRLACREPARQPGVWMPLRAWLEAEARGDDACLEPDQLGGLFQAIARYQRSLATARPTGPFKAATFALANEAEEAWSYAYALCVAAHGAHADDLASGILGEQAPRRNAG
jgi:hypothetical protein